MIKDSIKIPNTKDSGIYMLFNFRNKKIYIGQTKNLSRRAYQHLHYFKHGTHPNKEMLKDYQSGDLFYFSILEKCKNTSHEQLIRLERIYMFSFLESGYSLYNDETKTVLKDLLFQDMVFSKVEEKQREMRKHFNMPISHLSFCRLEKIKDVLSK